MERWLSWSKAHDWKSCNVLKAFKGSNPFLSAKKEDMTFGHVFLLFICPPAGSTAGAGYKSRLSSFDTATRRSQMPRNTPQEISFLCFWKLEENTPQEISSKMMPILAGLYILSPFDQAGSPRAANN